MAGLLFFIILGLWFWGAISLAKLCTWRMQMGGLRTLTTVLATVFFFLLPLADEIIGGFQFRAICKRDAFFKIDAEKIKGKSVKSIYEKKVIQRFPIKITYTQYSYRDSQNGEELANYSLHEAEGGWLSRWIGFNTTNPWTFHSVCDLVPDRNFDFNIVR